MRKTSTLTALVALLSSCASPTLHADKSNTVALEEVLTGIRCEFVAYVAKHGDRFAGKKAWTIKGELVASIVKNSDTNGKADLKTLMPTSPIGFGLGGGVKIKQTSQATIKFALDAKHPSEGSCPKTDGFGLRSWLAGIDAAKNAGKGLTLQDSAYAFSLTFALTISGDASFDVKPLDATISDARSRDDVQNLTIAMAPPEPKTVKETKATTAPAFPLPGGSNVPYSEQLFPRSSTTTTTSRTVLVSPDLDSVIERKRMETFGGP